MDSNEPARILLHVNSLLQLSLEFSEMRQVVTGLILDHCSLIEPAGLEMMLHLSNVNVEPPTN